MRLYRMEFYKLCHKRVFATGVLAVIGLLLLYFLAEVGEELSVIEEHVYSGYEAVQINREITEEFAGAITNGKINQIIEKYGLPSKLVEGMPGWRDGNYLNDFVTRYFTNGRWENKTLPTQKYDLEETEFQKAFEEMGITPNLTYTTGWRVFTEMLQFGFVLGSVLVICVTSIAFAEEGQTKMMPLIFTTEKGRKGDIPAKIAASFTLTIFIFMGIVLIDFVLCASVYGLNGFENISGMVLSESMYKPVYRISFFKYLCITLGMGLLALLSLCAITLCVSAYQNNTFSAVIIAAVCWGMPVLLRMFFGGFMRIIQVSMPIFLIMRGIISDTYGIWYLALGINLCVSAGCLHTGIVHYKRKQGTE